MSRDNAALLDILRAAELAGQFTSGMDRAGFEVDIKTQSAVLHQLMLMGEAVTRLSDGFKEANDNVPWRLIVGMRNRLIHGYDTVDLDEVWSTVTGDVPELVRLMQPLVMKDPRRVQE